jgi:AcrR family transcriptional regulator
VLDASIALFLEGGANALTVDAVSERSGVAKTTIYRHWENRDALVVDAVRGCIPVVEHPDPELSFEEALRQAVRSLAAGLSDDRVRAALPHLIAAAAEMWDLGADYREVVEQQYAGLIGVLERGVAEGSLSEGTDVLEAKHQIFGPIFVTALSPDDPLGDDEADRVVELFLASRRRDW